mgnify:CR=1 FL=1
MLSSKILASLIVLSISFMPAFADAPKQKTKTVEKPLAKSGPDGVGAIKIGMTKEQVEMLNASDETYLTFQMTPCTRTACHQKTGVDKFDTWVKTPLNEASISTVLGFSGGVLSSIDMDFEKIESAYHSAVAQITQKYGKNIVLENKDEEMCLYKNGANFKVPNESSMLSWERDVSESNKILTIAYSVTRGMCPSNLRYGDVERYRHRSISIEATTKEPNKAPSKPAF